ncbi:hypothetical protein SDC9_171614 [bioreactor metagenome]|uniref:Uncharacterized protein n=1 Tax=bioreactor metagenome TaxID=1076179 RepID=A0A645GDR1_9ZZZZ
MIAGNATLITLCMTDDYAISKWIQAVFFAKRRKELDCRFISTFSYCFCFRYIRAGEGGATNVFDTSRLTHFYTDMRIIGSPASMPATMVPRKCLIHSSVIAINKCMYTGSVITGTIPVLNKYCCTWLRAAYRM